MKHQIIPGKPNTSPLFITNFKKSFLSAKNNNSPQKSPNRSVIENLSGSNRVCILRQQSQKISKVEPWGNNSSEISEKSTPVKKCLPKKQSQNVYSKTQASFQKYNFQLKPILSGKLQKSTLKIRESSSTQPHSPKSVILNSQKIDEYLIIKHLGEGRFGSVYLAIHRKTGFIGALKIMKRSEIDSLPPQKRQKIKSQIISQIKIQSFLEHPNLIKLYDFFFDRQQIYLFVELGSEGHLYNLIKRQKSLSEESTSIIIREITQGIKYMHSKSVMHRDIKLQNIVFTHGMAKICDFGWSVYQPTELRNTLCGTPLYLSPEILKGKKYNHKIDIWALGTLTHEIFTNENPFKIASQKQLQKIVTDEVQMKVGSPQIRSFVTFLLKKIPERRPDAQIILKHPFIKKYKDIETSQQICDLSTIEE